MLPRSPPAALIGPPRRAADAPGFKASAGQSERGSVSAPRARRPCFFAWVPRCIFGVRRGDSMHERGVLFPVFAGEFVSRCDVLILEGEPRKRRLQGRSGQRLPDWGCCADLCWLEGRLVRVTRLVRCMLCRHENLECRFENMSPWPSCLE